jgi:hypothetical protein
MKIAFLANGPGEVWGWCRPLLLESKRRHCQVDIHLLPCPYASGRELEALSKFSAPVFLHRSILDAVRCFSKKLSYDVILQLGGDLMFGRFLAWKQKAPLVCYSYGLKKGMNRCSRVLTSREGLFNCAGLEVVGDLVLDSIDDGEESKWHAPQGKRIAVFPGSRPNIRHKVFSLLNEIKKRLAQRDPQIELRVFLSPFADCSEYKVWQEGGFTIWTGATSAGVCGADLALTQPGTNNLELMYCGIPFVVTIPYSFLRELPLSGLIGMIDKIPVFGASLRERVIRKKIPRYIGKTTWPNRLAHETFVPELIGEYSGEQLAEAVIKILLDKKLLEKQKKKFRELTSQVTPGASQRIFDILEKVAAEKDEQ